MNLCGSDVGYDVLDQAETCTCVAVMLTIMYWSRLGYVLVWQCGSIFGYDVLGQAETCACVAVWQYFRL